MMRSIFSILFSFLAGALLLSCQKEDAPAVEEELNVSPGKIEAPASSASYRIDVTSNTRWTVVVEGKDAADVSWVTLGRTSGKGDLSVTARINENRYNEPREASILFRTDGGKSVAVTLSQAGNEAGEDAPADDIFVIGTYNLRMSHLDNGTDNAWDTRKERLKKSLLACPFDVFGIQEVDDKMQAWLDSELSSKYAFRYFSPYSKDGNGSRAQGIGYRKDKFTLSGWHFFWACDTPDVMTVNDKGSQGNFNRGGCCCVITHKVTGKKIFVMNNHGCLNSQSNKDAAHVYVEMEEKFNKEGLPSFFVGDMNAKQSVEPESVYVTFTAHWQDSFLKAPKREGANGTYSGYTNPAGSSRIDYVFYRGDGITPQSYHCDNTLFNGFYASDHFPVWTEFKIEK